MATSATLWTARPARGDRGRAPWRGGAFGMPRKNPELLDPREGRSFTRNGQAIALNNGGNTQALAQKGSVPVSNGSR